MIMRIPILKSILRNLDWFEEARRHHVAPDGSILLGGTNHRLKKDGDWEESKHPRADNGQFGSGSGTSHGKESQGAKRKRTAQARRAESAGQTQLGHTDHIQTLLSGGSALDKIGWLKKPEKPKAEKPKAKPTAQKKPKLPSESDLIGTGVTDQNYREFLDRGIENLSRNEYIAAKQSQYYVEQNGKVLSTQAAAKLYDQEKVKPSEPAKRPNAVPTNEELDASGVYDQNYKDYLKKPPESLSLAEYVAAKQSQYYVERGDILSAETAAEWYHAAVSEEPKAERKTPAEISLNAALKNNLLQPRAKRILRQMSQEDLTGLIDEINNRKLSGPAVSRYINEKYPEKPRVSLADQATALKLKELKELPLSKLRSMQAALQKHPKINNPAYPEGKKYDKALRAVEGAIYSKA